MSNESKRELPARKPRFRIGQGIIVEYLGRRPGTIVGIRVSPEAIDRRAFWQYLVEGELVVEEAHVRVTCTGSDIYPGAALVAEEFITSPDRAKPN